MRKQMRFKNNRRHPITDSVSTIIQISLPLHFYPLSLFTQNISSSSSNPAIPEKAHHLHHHNQMVSASASPSLLLDYRSFKWKQACPVHLPPLRPLSPSPHLIKPLRICTVICCLSVKHNTAFFSNRKVEEEEENVQKKKRNDPFDILASTILNALKALRKPAIAAVLLGLLLIQDPNSALAASGGRVGGRAFSSHSSSSSSSSSRSYSVPSNSGFTYSTPYYAPSPFGFSGGGFYVGPAVGVGVGAGSSFTLILVGFMAFVLVSGFLSDRSEGGVLTAVGKTSVLKLQVGLLGMGRVLQRDLNRIAETANTSTPEGLSYVLTETSLALLRHPDYCISGYSSVDLKRSMEDGEKRFNQLSIEERGKFDEETLVNVNSIKKQSTSSLRAGGFSNEYIVVSILVAAEGVHKLPSINGSGDLKEALQKLASIPASKILAVEVLWTPQNENDSLSEQELLEDYPLLRPL